MNSELMEYAWSWETSEDHRGRTLLEVRFRTCKPAEKARFVEVYERENDCELEFVEGSTWQVNYNEDED